MVAVGYQATGTTGAIAGWAAMTAPGLAVIPLLVVFRRYLRHPRVRSGLQCIVIASAAPQWSFMRRHLQFHGLAIQGIDTEIGRIRKQLADRQAASSTDAGT